MRNLITVVLFAALAMMAVRPEVAQAEGGGAVKALQTAAKSKAALKLADIIGAYLIGKAFDEAYKYATAPDPKLLDESLIDLQKQNPDYSLMLGTLRRAARTDGTPVSRAEFESLARDLVFQLDHAQLSSPQTVAPTLQFNPAKSPLTLPALGERRLDSDLWLKALNGPLGARYLDTTPRLTIPISVLPKEDPTLALKLVGAWTFPRTFNRDDLKGAFDVFIFHRDGKFTAYKVFEQYQIKPYYGTYSLEGKRLSITMEVIKDIFHTFVSTIEEIDGGHIKYLADKTAFDSAAPEAQTLTRISDAGQLSAVTIKNPTGVPLQFQVRWATVNGIWTELLNYKFLPQDSWTISYPGAFFCQITFDASFDPDRQDKTIEVPFHVISSPNDPKRLEKSVYSATFDGRDVDIVSDALWVPEPAVR